MNGGLVEGGAFVSLDRHYRYVLTRRWAAGGSCNFVMLNPSTADALEDDPTIRRCMRFASDFGCGSLVVTNLFAYRCTDPRHLFLGGPPISPPADERAGDQNDGVILGAACAAGVVVCAWGAAKDRRVAERAAKVVGGMRRAGVRLHHLRLTSGGQPCHPLYLPGDLRPVVWEDP